MSGQGEPIVRATGVGVRYVERSVPVAALAEVDLVIGEGERVALWGPSGSGKTTLLYVLGGLVEPSSGTVERREGLTSAFIFQGANLLPTFTAVENVAFAASVANGAVSGDAPEPQALLEVVGLGAKAEALPAELSGGEAQRVAIARALAQQPGIVYCDEPTGHLDSDTGRRVLDVIDALQERLGFALVTATHDDGVAGRLARRVEMADGHAKESDIAEVR
jgi:ABC-type lipoprotein export system ATPase subunit